MAELSEQPFVGRVSHAKVMGVAMERLREGYDVNAPRGWLPVMRILRSSSGSAAGGSSPALLGSSTIRTAGQSPASPAPHEEEEGTPESRWFKQRAAPCDVLTDVRSGLHFYDASLEPADSLLTLAERKPPFKALLISLAENMGVPKDLPSALSYTEAVIAELRKQGEPVPEKLERICDDARRRIAVMEERKAEKELPASGGDTRFPDRGAALDAGVELEAEDRGKLLRAAEAKGLAQILANYKPLPWPLQPQLDGDDFGEGEMSQALDCLVGMMTPGMSYRDRHELGTDSWFNYDMVGMFGIVLLFVVGIFYSGGFSSEWPDMRLMCTQGMYCQTDQAVRFSS